MGVHFISKRGELFRTILICQEKNSIKEQRGVPVKQIKEADRDGKSPLFIFQFSFNPREWLEIFIEAQECRSRFERERKRGSLGGLVLPAFFLIFVAAGLFEVENSAPAAILGLLLFVLFYLFHLLLRGKRERIRYRRLYRRGRLPMEQASEWRIVIYEDDLTAEYGMTWKSCPFSQLQDAAETEKYLFLFGQTGDFYPIPKSAMDEEEKKRFWEMIEKRLDNS